MTKEFSPMTSDSDETNDMQRLDEKESPVETPADDVEDRFATQKFSTMGTEEVAVSEYNPEKHNTNAPMPNPLLNFSQAGFTQDILDAIANAQWKAPRMLDSLSLPQTLSGKDVVIQASSKTSAITFLTLAHRLNKFKADNAGETPAPQAIVLYPSAGPAMKGCQDFRRLFSTVSLTAVSLVDSEELGTEQLQEDLSNADIIFASTSSLKSACLKKQMGLENVSVCVCRDVEGIFEAGAGDDLEYLLSRLADAQKILFSGSVPKKVKDLASEFLRNTQYVSLERERATIPSVMHASYLCETPNKFKVLLGLLQDQTPTNAIVFANSKLTAAWLYHKLMENGYNSELLGSDLPLTKGEDKPGQAKIFVGTDFITRDFRAENLSHVYNFDLPDSGEAYLNRMSQVGKDGSGTVCSFICDEYGENYQHVQDLLGQKAPKPVWHKEAYLKIVDKSGNPFLEKNIGYVPKRFDERPHRGGGHDRHKDGDRRPPFRGRGDRPERGERMDRDRPERGDRIERIERNDRPERSERIERNDRPDRIERNDRPDRIERNDRPDRGDRHERSDRGERFGGRSERADRDRGDREETRKPGPSSKGPQIKPRAPKKVHTGGGGGTKIGPIEQRRVIPRADANNGGFLKKFFSMFLPKKKK